MPEALPHAAAARHLIALLACATPAVAQAPTAPPPTPSSGPAVGMPAVVHVRDLNTGATTQLAFKQSGLNAGPAAPRLDALPGPGHPVVTPLALHWEIASSWRLRAPAQGPGPRLGPTMAFDPVRGTVLVHGGAYGGPLGDLWEWNGITWAQLLPPNPPPARQRAAMATDTAQGRVVLFGGSGAGGVLQDTWAWNGAVWTQLGNGPAARRDHAMAWHAASGRTVLMGGWPSDLPANELADTWTLDNAGIWQLQGGPGPGARAGHAMAYDAARQRVVLFGGYRTGVGSLDDTWEWNGANWSLINATLRPSPRYGHALSYDAARQRVVLTGGALGATPCDTWEWDGTCWMERLPELTLQTRYQHAMAYDSARGAMVLFGGMAVVPGLFPADTWTCDGPTRTLTVNDISLGVDFVPVAPVGGVLTVSVPPMAWIGLAFSVTADTVGAPGSLLAQEAAGNRACADLFSYVFRGSDPNCIPAAEIGQVRRAVDSTEGTTQTADNVRDVKGLDLFLPAYDLQPNLLLDPPTNQPTIYFTVARNALANAPPSWWAGSTPSAATILRSQWDPVAATWSCPSLWLLYSDLQVAGNPLTSDEEIDALVLGNNGPPGIPPRYLLFSTNRLRGNNQPTAAPDQLMVADVTGFPATAASAVTLASVDSSNLRIPVSQDLGLGNGDVDAACGWDPCTSVVGRRLFQRFFGRMTEVAILGTFPHVAGGAYRDNIAGSNRLTTLTVGGARPGFAVLYASDPGLTTFLSLGVVATGPLPNTPATLQFALPAAPIGGTVLLHWIDIDPLFSTIRTGSVALDF